MFINVKHNKKQKKNDIKINILLKYRFNKYNNCKKTINFAEYKDIQDKTNK